MKHSAAHGKPGLLLNGFRTTIGPGVLSLVSQEGLVAVQFLREVPSWCERVQQYTQDERLTPLKGPRDGCESFSFFWCPSVGIQYTGGRFPRRKTSKKAIKINPNPNPRELVDTRASTDNRRRVQGLWIIFFSCIFHKQALRRSNNRVWCQEGNAHDGWL